MQPLPATLPQVHRMQPPESAPSRRQNLLERLLRLTLRLALIVIITYGFGWVLNKSATSSDTRPQAAGFGRGMLHGALMPGAMPSLLFGKDVVIYSANNNGRLYKLGYTCGVNAMGAFFFGSFYLRLSRWRKNYAAKS
jgi:hypothetical protein